MRKINKDYSDIPTSLIPAYGELFERGLIHKTSRLTHQRRTEVIENGVYIDENKYNSRYKYDDVKKKLSSIYYDKCAFCEQRIEQSHVEHYRPKKGKNKGTGQHHDGYHWLAFSWDNLLLSCPDCNTNKGTHFDITDTRVTFNASEDKIKGINTLSSSYDITESPKMVNPEVTDPDGFIEFNREGKICSNDDRFVYTIEKCNLDRDYLNDGRRKIFDDFEKKMKSKILKYAHSPDLLKSHLHDLISEYISDANDLTKEYTAFRKYSISNGWLKTSLSAVMGNF